MGRLEYPFPVAVKTGTSSNYHDAWTVAFSGRYLVAAWVGHPDYRPMTGVSGYRCTAELVRKILLLLHRDQTDGLPNVGFPPPRGFSTGKLCALTGHRATPACDRVFVEHFRRGQQPTEPCTAHRMLAIDSRNGQLATSFTPKKWLGVRTFTDLGPRYADWQQRQAIPHPPRLTSRLGSETGGYPQALFSEPTRLAVAAARISITAPSAGMQVLRDPETPPDRTTLALRAVVDPPVEQLVWYVDGAPYQVADYPYTVRWPLAPGEHVFQARLPFAEERSNLVRVTVH